MLANAIQGSHSVFWRDLAAGLLKCLSGYALLSRQSVHHLPVRPRYQVPVYIHGHLDTGMPELLLDVSQRVPGLNEQAGERVAKIMF